MTQKQGDGEKPSPCFLLKLRTIKWYLGISIFGPHGEKLLRYTSLPSESAEYFSSLILLSYARRGDFVLLKVKKSTPFSVLGTPSENQPRLTRFPRETASLWFEPDSASLCLQSRFDCEDDTKREPIVRIGSLFVAPATGIEPVTNP